MKRKRHAGNGRARNKLHDYVVGKNETGALPEDVAPEMQELLEEVQSVASQHIFTAAAYLHAKLEIFILLPMATGAPGDC